MSTIVSYKNQNIAVAKNNTKVLKTAGKYLEANVNITDIAGRKMPQEWEYFKDLGNENTNNLLVAAGINADYLFIRVANASSYVEIYGGENGTTLLNTFYGVNRTTWPLGYHVDTRNEDFSFLKLQGKPYHDEYLGDIELFTVVIYSSTWATEHQKTKPFIACDLATTSGVWDGYADTNQSSYFEFCTFKKPITAFGTNAFSSSGIRDFDVPKTVTIFGSSTFQYSRLEHIKLPDTLTSIGGNSFYGSLLREIDIPIGVTSIEGNLFYDCKELRKVSLSPNTTIIKTGAFRGCTSLPTIDLPDTITEIQANVFYGCSLLRKIEIPEGVTTLGQDLFYGCYSLFSAILPSTLTDITPLRMFYGCTNLQKLECSATNTSAVDGSNMFYNCRSLAYIDMPNIKLKALGCSGTGTNAMLAIGSLPLKHENLPINIDWENFGDGTITKIWDTSYTNITETQYLTMFQKLADTGRSFAGHTFVITQSVGATQTVRDFITGTLHGTVTG